MEVIIKIYSSQKHLIFTKLSLIDRCLPTTLSCLKETLEAKRNSLTGSLSLGKLESVITIREVKARKPYTICDEESYEIMRAKALTAAEGDYDICCKLT